MRKQATKFIAWLALALTISYVGITGLTFYNNLVTKHMPLEAVLVDKYEQSSIFTGKMQQVIDAAQQWQTTKQQAMIETLEPGFSYYFTNQQQVLTNITTDQTLSSEFFTKYSRYFIANVTNGSVEVTHYTNDFYVYNYDDQTITGKIYIAYTDLAALAEAQALWTSQRMILNEDLARTILGFVAMLVLLIYLVITAGRSDKDQSVHLSLYDKIYPELNILLLFGVGVGLIATMVGVLANIQYFASLQVLDPVMLLVMLGLTLGWLSFVGIFLSIIRQIKAGTIITKSITYRLLSLIFRPFVELFKLGKRTLEGKGYINFPLAKQLVLRQLGMVGAMIIWLIITIIIGVISGSWILLGFLLLGGEGLIILWSINGTYQLSQQLDQGVGNSQKAQQQSENTKTQLITNVSHDLKTPLTSIVTYLDLLAKEELTPTANDYVKILTTKAQRLNQMVADLFDLSKSVSGNLQLEIEELDLGKLMQQMLAEMNDQLTDEQFTIKATIADTPMLVMSDGQKIYRILQNVLDNAKKYALPQTRIFVNVQPINNNVVISIQNTANYEMDFTAEEVMQRFARGDKARSSEGSGLGLSIAESFTQSCGGTFKVQIEGDQFKTYISFPVVTPAK